MLVINLVRVRDGSAEAEIAKITPKKNRTATAMAPNNVMIFTFICGVASHNLTLPFNGQDYISISDICLFLKLSL